MTERLDIDPPVDAHALPEWRKHVRKRLLEQREALDPQTRAACEAQVKKHLLENLMLGRYRTIGVYWPTRGEVDVRDLAREHVAAGGEVALPVVTDRRGPLEFWRWDPQGELVEGAFGIPIPSVRAPLEPDALIIPLLGFDQAGYRLGYGGGFYDRTLAAAARRPFCIGVGFAEAELASIYPQAHDLPMDAIVTEAFVRRFG